MVAGWEDRKATNISSLTHLFESVTSQSLCTSLPARSPALQLRIQADCMLPCLPAPLPCRFKLTAKTAAMAISMYLAFQAVFIYFAQT